MTETGMIPNWIGAGIEQHAAVDRSSAKAAELEGVGQEFESVFLSLMLKEMRNTLENGGFFGEESSDTYGGLFDMFIGQHIAKSSPLGISEIVAQSYERNSAAHERGDGEAQNSSDSISIKT